MKAIQVTFKLSDDLRLKSVEFDYNDTHLESDSKLLERLAFTLLKSLSLNKDSLPVQDLLNELGIEVAK